MPLRDGGGEGGIRDGVYLLFRIRWAVLLATAHGGRDGRRNEATGRDMRLPLYSMPSRSDRYDDRPTVVSWKPAAATRAPAVAGSSRWRSPAAASHSSRNH